MTMATTPDPCPPPPLVPGLPLLGSATQLFREPTAFLLRQYRRHGPIFRVKAAHLEYVVMAGPEANEFAHGPGSHFLSGKRFWRPFLEEVDAPSSIVGLDGDDHAELRRILAPGMSKRFAEDHVTDIVRITRACFSDLSCGERIPFVRFSQRLVSRQVGFIMTGEVPSLKEHDAILRYLSTASIDLSLRRLPRVALRLRGKRFRDDKRRSFAFADRLVSARRNSPARHVGDFIDTILDAAGRLPHLFSSGDIRMSGLLPFFAGIDTVGQTIAFAVYEVLRRPQLLVRLREEIDAVWKSGGPSGDELRKLTCLHGLVLETLRLHPTAFAMSRTATEDFSFAGHRVARGQDVLVFTTACHFLEEHFPEPERFDIDRYAPPRNEHRQPGVFAPFGRGPHTCLGASFSLVQLATTLGTILHSVELELEDPRREYKTVLMPSPSLGNAFEVIFRGSRPQGSPTANERLRGDVEDFETPMIDPDREREAT
jgi:cytochrome P450